MIEFKNYNQEDGTFEVHYSNIGMIGSLEFDGSEGMWLYSDDGVAWLDGRDMRVIAAKLDELGYES